jgi:hypothetical protein
MNAPAGQAPGPRPVPWFRLARVTLRQRRGLFTGLGVLLGLFAAYLTTVAIIQGNAYATVAACHPSGLAALSSAQAGLHRRVLGRQQRGAAERRCANRV